MDEGESQDNEPTEQLHSCVGKEAFRVQRSKWLAKGAYVRDSVNRHPVTFTADTGAPRTIISTRVFNQLPPEARPQLDQTSMIVGAGGAPIKDAGQTNLDLSLGPLKNTETSMVAVIEDDALLGNDILNGSSGRPDDIPLSSNETVRHPK